VDYRLQLTGVLQTLTYSLEDSGGELAGVDGLTNVVVGVDEDHPLVMVRLLHLFP
jgi:hypothetical protein